MIQGPRLKRFLAFVIDSVGAFVLALIPHLGPFLAALYIVLRDGLHLAPLKNRSLGKAVIGLKVVQAETGAPLEDWLDSVRRNWLFLVPFAALVEGGVRLADPLGRRFGDRLAKSRVVEE